MAWTPNHDNYSMHQVPPPQQLLARMAWTPNHDSKYIMHQSQQLLHVLAPSKALVSVRFVLPPCAFSGAAGAAAAFALFFLGAMIVASQCAVWGRDDVDNKIVDSL